MNAGGVLRFIRRFPVVPAGIAVFLLASCFSSEKVAGGSSSTETGTQVSLTGRVIDKDNAGISGVIVASARLGLADTTDSQGRYHIQGKLDSGALARVASLHGAGLARVSEEALDMLVFTQNEQEVAALPVSKWVDNLPDIKIIQRDISGTVLPGPVAIAKVEAVISGDGIPAGQPVVIEFFYNALASHYSGFAYFRGTAALANYAVFIKVYDSLGRFTGRSLTIPFNSNAGNIVIPAFNPGNALPKAIAGRDTLLSVGDTLLLRGTVVDSFGGTVSKWEWDVGGAGFVETSSGDTAIVLPPIRTQDYRVVLRITDDDGHLARDSFAVNVINDNPAIVSGLRDTTVSVNDTMTFTVLATDPEGIRRYLWDLDGDGVFEDTTASNVRSHAYPSAPGLVRSVVRVEDNFDGVTLDTGLVNVILDKPVPTIQGNATVKVGVSITLTAQVVQQFGYVVMYGWDDGKGGGWVDSSVSMTQATFMYQTKGTYPVRLYVRDDDGNVDSTTKIITVGNDNPVVSGMRDTTVSVNDSVTFTVVATDLEGIRRYLWDLDGNGIFEDTTVSNVHGHKYPSVQGLVRSIVRVEDNFDGFTLDTALVNVILDKPVPTVQGNATVKVNVSIQFTAQVVQHFGSVVMYGWDDGKGGGWVDSSVEMTQAVFTYMTRGAYPVRLYVRDDDGNVDSATKIITVGNDNPVVVASLRDTTVSINDTVPFTITATDPEGIKWYLWNYGADGTYEDTTLTESCAFVMPSTPGQVKVAVTIHDNFDGMTHDTATVTVMLDPPVPTVQGNVTVKVNVPITFTAQVMQEFGHVVMYGWDDGKGGGWVDSSAEMTQAMFTYQTKGAYTVRLYIRDDDGNVDSTVFNLTVWNDDPVVSGMRDTTVSISDTVNMIFTVTATDPEGIKWYLWDLDGDGMNEDTTSENNKTLVFSSSVPTVRKVIVTAWDNFDGFTRDTATINVILDPPIPAIQGNSMVKVGAPITFTAQVMQEFGRVVMYKWDDGKGGGWVDSSAGLNQVAFTYQTKGSYPVRLYVRDDDGNADSTVFNLTVWNDDPVISGLRDTAAFSDDTVTFTVSATDPEGVRPYYIWNFNGVLDTTQENKKSFVMPDPQIVTMIVTVFDNFDGKTNDTVTITIADGIWTTRLAPISQLNSVVWTGSQLVSVGGINRVSLNGESWSSVSGGGGLMSVAWTDSQLVAVGDNGIVRTSLDGTTWTTRVSSGFPRLCSVVWTGSQLVTVGHAGLVRTSLDGVTWTTRDSSGGELYSVVWTGDQLVTVGEQGIIRTSPDGVTWTPRVFANESSPPLRSVAWTGTRLVAVGHGGTVRTSLDGVTWQTQATLEGAPNLEAVVRTGNRLVVVGYGGTIRFSTDEGAAWSAWTSGVPQNLHSIIWTGTRFVVVGDIILTSP